MTVPRLWARCVHGLERIAADEMSVRLGANAVVAAHRDVECESDDLSAALELRTVDDIYLLAGVASGVGRTKGHLRALAAAASRLAISDVIELRSRHLAAPGFTALAVTASFLGSRNFSRFDIEDAVGTALARVVGTRYRSRRYGAPPAGALEWRVHVSDDEARIGLRIAPRPLHRRGYKLAAPPGTTHPPLAAAMVRLADPPGGRVLWDPTCGAGTIPIEAGLLNSGVWVGGSDIREPMTRAAVANVRRAGVRCEIVLADASRLPLLAESVDAIVANLPWGRQAQLLGGLVHHSGTFAREVNRVLVPGGCAVLLTDDADAPPRFPDLELAEDLPLRLMGSRPRLRVWRLVP